jgi:hypothetical protein
MDEMLLKTSRLRFRFSLRSLLLLVAVVAIPLASHVNRVRNQRLVVAELSSVGGGVIYDYDFQQPSLQEPTGPRWLRSMVGDDFFAQVSEVDINHDQVTDQMLARIATLPALSNLLLCSGRISDSGLGHLAELSTLQRVDVQSPGISDASLAQLAKIKGLKYLTVSSPKLTDAGLEYIAKLKELEDLAITTENVTGDGLAQIAKLPHLKDLYIVSEELTDAGLVHLHRAPKLKKIILFKGKVTQVGIERLREARPGCMVHWARNVEHGKFIGYGEW